MPPSPIAATAVLLLSMATPVRAETLTADEAVRRALERSPAVRAARQRTEAARLGIRAAETLPPLRVEVAPGIGFTNGNALLSQNFDISGTRSARAQRARAERDATSAVERRVRQKVAGEMRLAYFDLVRARQAEGRLEEARALVREIGQRVARRVQIGEAPAVHELRAQIETARIEEEHARAVLESRSKRAVLNRLLGRAPDAALVPADPLTVPESPPPPSRDAVLRRRPEMEQARAVVRVDDGLIAQSRAAARPTLSADVAADFWSVDRRPGQRPIGLQLRYSLPFGKDAVQQAETARVRAERAAHEAEMEAQAQAIEVEIERAAVALEAARDAAQSYRLNVLPKVERLLAATRRGFDDGLVSFVEVLEAQRVERSARLELENLLFEAVRARIDLDAALGENPE